jgi:hypothetical protein
VIRFRSWIPAAALCALASGAGVPARAGVAPVALEDSTVFESYVLANGLRVAARHVPGCRHVDITVAYDHGTSDDPPGKEGLADLLAELQFYGATTGSPERTREEMAGLRPLGWDLVVSPRVTRFSEIVPVDLLPGLVHLTADRMRGVRVTTTALRTAIASVRAERDTAWRIQQGMALHHAARVWATGGGEPEFARAAAVRGIQGLAVREAQQRLDAAFAPANAVLAIAGDLRRIPLRALIQSEFGSIPKGAPVRGARAAKFDSASGVVARPGLKRPSGVVGLIAPALADSMHPAFFMELALVGGHSTKTWGAPEPPLTSRFHYSIYDDPDLARFYPPVGPGESDPALLGVTFLSSLNDLTRMRVPPTSYMALWRGLDWLLGGAMPTEIYERVLREPGALHTLCTGTAVRELWGGEPFWSKYRQRFQKAVGTPYPEWHKRLLGQRYVVKLLFVPAQ